MFAQADYSPDSSPEATSRVNGFINRAYNTLALEAPFLFFESKVHLVTEPDVTSKSTTVVSGITYGDRIQLKGANTGMGADKDPWTWHVTSPTTVTSKFLTAWKTDRSWDGRMIEITTEDGTKIRNQIRSIWLDTSGGIHDQRYSFTLVTPWNTDTYGDGTATIDGAAGFKYRIFTEAYPLPDDVIQLKSARLRDQDINYPLDVFGQEEAAQFQLKGPPSQVASGIPRVVFREHHVHMRGPSVPPVASVPPEEQGADTVYWIGPEPEGSFQYKVTYTWGKRDVEFQLPGLAGSLGFAQPVQQKDTTTYPSSSTTDRSNTSEDRFRTPRFESPSSPESSVATVVPAGLNTLAVKLSLPNITYALGFLNQFSGGGYSRQSLNQSGVYIRIYRKRLTTDMSRYAERPALTAAETRRPAVGLKESQIDAPEDYCLLAELRADSVNGGVWYDRGDILPDYNCRLREIHGYQTMAFYPKPDKRYVTEIRSVIRPQPLIDEQDTPLLHAEAMSVLIERAMALFYENLGQYQLSQLSSQKYREALLTLSKRYGDLRPPNTPVLRRMTRAQSSYRSNRYYRKWYTTSS